MVARPSGLLVDQDGAAGFGHQQHWLRDLNDGWQMLETQGFHDPPDLLGPCAAVAGSTGFPVLSAYISDDYCAVMSTAVPGRGGPLTHLWNVERPCQVFRHQPSRLADPIGRSLDAVVDELTAWSAAAGLPADVDGLRSVVGRSDEEAQGQARKLVFELVKALGLTRIGRVRPRSLPLNDWPFSVMMRGYGAPYVARLEAASRAAGDEDAIPEQPWEAEALQLEAELWESLHRPGVDVTGLAWRCAHVSAAYRAYRRSQAAVLDQRDLNALAEIEARGAVAGPSELEARRWADEPLTGQLSRDEM